MLKSVLALAAALAALNVAPSGAAVPAPHAERPCPEHAARVVIATPGALIRITARGGQPLVVTRGDLAFAMDPYTSQILT
jgi:hypothetical protein